MNEDDSALLGRKMASLSLSPACTERFICIYPAYINSKKTIAEGRRIPVEKAVENPTFAEIYDVCSAAGLNVVLEKSKLYPREWNRDAQYRGRVRVQLKKEDGSLCLQQFPSRKAVMLYAAEMIPKLKIRTQKMGGGDPSTQQGEGGKKGKKKKK
ncbi:signal recognition particle 19 kDa protein [Latimeria chalumnae]|uniref:Signal recognition particle 19 kDa protein n=1 Tax=Latimeria chalumnae TaxID=7897 RepID=H3A5U6_LATCH|nr:PREDICTED: signal recognition particle 19 kDa protein [Latimeria chalumnae]|eukprot:XP_006007938.1 PREDICTED: signal recognition particle 19 kDa protein [Latimeria chalumnae]